MVVAAGGSVTILAKLCRRWPVGLARDRAGAARLAYWRDCSVPQAGRAL